VTDEHVLVICIMLFLPYFAFYDFASPINRLSSNYVEQCFGGQQGKICLTQAQGLPFY